MWEKPRIDGKRKLKHNAVSTIFNNVGTCNVNTSAKNEKVETASNSSDEVDISAENKEVLNNEHQLFDYNSLDLSMSNLFVVSSSEDLAQVEKQLSATGHSSEQPAICNDFNDLKLKLLQAEKRAQEATLKFQQANKVINRIEKSRKMLKKHVRRLEDEKKILQHNLKSKLQLRLKEIFNDDQMQILLGRKSRNFKWSNNTVLKALQLKFLCGSNGYNELLNQHLPLPSERTLRRRKENVNFEPGILHDVFDILEKQVSLFKDSREKDATIAVDEMSIVPGKQFDPSTLSHIGNANIPDSSGQIQKASHALVVMLAGIFSRWKQVVAFYYTPNGFNGTNLKTIIETIIIKAESIGLYVHSITSDMGSVNQSMWKAFGNISAGKCSPINNFICHPANNVRKLFFLADAPHLLKNLRSCLENNKIIELPETFVHTHKLSSSIVRSKHLNELVELQENLIFKLTPKFKHKDLISRKYNKMKVNTARNVMSMDVSSALTFLAEEKHKIDYKTTASFIKVVSQWFTLITSRSQQVALGITSGNEKSEKKYHESIEFLESIIQLFRNLAIGHDHKFKPVQCGIMITTKSIIELTKYLINERGYVYVLTSRFTQDCVENLFSQIRAKHQIPNALQFKQDLKELCISRFIKPSKYGSYDQDDRQFVCDFLSKPKKDSVEQLPHICIDFSKQIYFNNIELNVLYSVAGYIVHSIATGKSRTCAICLDSAGSTKSNTNIKYAKFVHLRCFRNNTLFFVTTEVFQYFITMEFIIRQYLPHLTNIKCNFIRFFVDKFKNMSISCESIENCHQLSLKIMKRFIAYRMKIACTKGIN